MEEKNIAVYDLEGNKTGEVGIPEKLSGIEVSVPFLHEIVKAYMANQRKGTAATKTRHDVRGGGIKPWRQKGTGRARAGSIRSPLWRHGGIIFGPHPRSYRQDLPKKKHKLGLNMALKSKLTDNELIIIKDLVADTPKTKKIYDIMKKLKVKDQKVLLVINELNENIKLAARNMKKLEVRNPASVNTYDVLNSDKVVICENAVSQLFKEG